MSEIAELFEVWGRAGYYEEDEKRKRIVYVDIEKENVLYSKENMAVGTRVVGEGKNFKITDKSRTKNLFEYCY